MPCQFNLKSIDKIARGKLTAEDLTKNIAYVDRAANHLRLPARYRSGLRLRSGPAVIMKDAPAVAKDVANRERCVEQGKNSVG